MEGFDDDYPICIQKQCNHSYRHNWIQFILFVSTYNTIKYKKKNYFIIELTEVNK